MRMHGVWAAAGALRRGTPISLYPQAADVSLWTRQLPTAVARLQPLCRSTHSDVDDRGTYNIHVRLPEEVAGQCVEAHSAIAQQVSSSVIPLASGAVVPHVTLFMATFQHKDAPELQARYV